VHQVIFAVFPGLTYQQDDSGTRHVHQYRLRMDLGLTDGEQKQKAPRKSSCSWSFCGKS